MKALKLKMFANTDCRKSLKVISYLFILNLVPFILKNSDSDVAFHAKQGFIQMLIWLLIPYVLIIPLVGWVIGILLAAANLAIMISGIYYASTDKRIYVPFIGKFAEKILS